MVTRNVKNSGQKQVLCEVLLLNNTGFGENVRNVKFLFCFLEK